MKNNNEIRKISKAYLNKPFSESLIMELCEKLEIRCSFKVGMITIRTDVASWRISMNDKSIHEVWHQNLSYINLSRRGSSFELGYHKQPKKDFYNNIYSTISYICCHDSSFVKKTRKDRMADLFAQIETA